jgi:hypothetical protein
MSVILEQLGSALAQVIAPPLLSGAPRCFAARSHYTACARVLACWALDASVGSTEASSDRSRGAISYWPRNKAATGSVCSRLDPRHGIQGARWVSGTPCLTPCGCGWFAQNGRLALNMVSREPLATKRQSWGERHLAAEPCQEQPHRNLAARGGVWRPGGFRKSRRIRRAR